MADYGLTDSSNTGPVDVGRTPAHHSIGCFVNRGEGAVKISTGPDIEAVIAPGAAVTLPVYGDFQCTAEPVGAKSPAAVEYYIGTLL